MAAPIARCSLCELELVAPAPDEEAIEVVRSVYLQHLTKGHQLARDHAESVAEAWAEAERSRLG